jgi:hypothetical protein
MNNFFPKQNVRLLISFFLILYLSCEREPTNSVFVEEQQSKPDPVITSIEPPNSGLGGIGEITIKGSNFSPAVGENAVFFGSKPAVVISASESELVVQSPSVIADSIEVKVSVIGAFSFSNIIYYTLETAVEELGGYGVAGEDLYAIAVDADENIYVYRSIRFIDIITPDTLDKAQSYATASVVTTGMKMGPGGYLYLVKGSNRNLYRIPPGGGNQSVFVRSLPNNVFDLDFDPVGNIYTAGDGDSLTIIYPDGSFETVAGYTDTFIKAVRVFNGYVYVAGNLSDSQEAVWRNQINAPNNLGPNEVVFDLTAELGQDIEIQSLTFAEDGDMYIGTTALDPILVVHPDGSSEPLYPGVLAPEMYDMDWGNDIYLYVSRRASVIAETETRILRINMQKKGAPYYGRDL